MIGVFADTSYFVALLQPNDASQPKLITYLSQNRPTIITTQYVLIEVANFFSRMTQRSKFDELMNQLDGDSVIVPASDQWFNRGRKLYTSRADKHWSLTDCISFEVMHEMNLSEALTADHHFEQAGFVALLK